MSCRYNEIEKGLKGDEGNKRERMIVFLSEKVTERERQRVTERGAERERERARKKLLLFRWALQIPPKWELLHSRAAGFKPVIIILKHE